MKKNLIKTALVAMFCLVVGYTAYNSQNKNENLSDVMLDNVEALANGELSNGNCEGTWTNSCCICGSVHYTYAQAISGRGCSTGSNCH